MTMIHKTNAQVDERCCLCAIRMLPNTSVFRHKGTDKIICVMCIVDITQIVANNSSKI